MIIKKQCVDLNDLLVWLGEKLPPGWDVKIYANSSEASISLEDPYGDDAPVCHDDMTTLEAIVADVNHAREKEGLALVYYPGL